MSAVGFQDAARYAVKLFGYLLAVVVVATGAISIGYWLVRPEISPALGRGTAEKAPLVGGSALIVIGAAILSIGTISAVYKLLADAVHAGGGPATTGEAAAVEPAAEPTDEREATPGQAGVAEAEDQERGVARTDTAAAASERARAAQAEADEGPAETAPASGSGEGDSTAVLGGDDTEQAEAGSEGVTIGSQAERETSPVPSDTETSPEPPDRETTPEPPERETGPTPGGADASPESPDRETAPAHPDRETNPEPPSESGDEADRPEPSAEEIAFGSGGGSDSDSGVDGEATTGDAGAGGAATGDAEDSTDEAEAVFTSKSVSGDEEADEESLDPMWSEEGTDETAAGSVGDEENDGGAGDDEAAGFEEPPIDEDVEPAGSGDRDPLADDE